LSILQYFNMSILQQRKDVILKIGETSNNPTTIFQMHKDR